MPDVISTMHPAQVSRLFDGLDKLGHAYHFDVVGPKPLLNLEMVIEGNPTPYTLHLHKDGTWWMEVKTKVEAP